MITELCSLAVTTKTLQVGIYQSWLFLKTDGTISANISDGRWSSSATAVKVKKTTEVALSYSVDIMTDDCFVFFTMHAFDRWMDRQTEFPQQDHALHYIQPYGKNDSYWHLLCNALPAHLVGSALYITAVNITVIMTASTAQRAVTYVVPLLCCDALTNVAPRSRWHFRSTL